MNSNIIRKTEEEYVLDRDGKVLVGGKVGVYKTTFRGIDYFAVESMESDNVSASINPAKAIEKAMRLAHVGGTGKAALDMAITSGKAVGTTALQAATLAVSVVGLATKLAGTTVGGLASIAQGETYKAGAAAVAAAVAPAVKHEKIQKSRVITEHEAQLTVYGSASVQIAGPFGEALVERLSDRHGDLFIVVGPSEIERCREAGDAVDVALAMVGLTVGSQLRETGRSLAASGKVVTGQASRLASSVLGGLATGLLAASDSIGKVNRHF